MERKSAKKVKDYSAAAIKARAENLIAATDPDVLVAGGGVAGLSTAFFLASAGLRVTLVEKEPAMAPKLWSGPWPVFSDATMPILNEMGIRPEPDPGGLAAVDPAFLASIICRGAAEKGAQLMARRQAANVTVKSHRVTGLLIDSPGEPGGLIFQARAVVDATGPEAFVCSALQNLGFRLQTDGGGMAGAAPLDPAEALGFASSGTRPAFPGLYPVGSALASVFGAPAPGPSKEVSLASGKAAAALIIAELGMPEAS